MSTRSCERGISDRLLRATPATVLVAALAGFAASGCEDRGCDDPRRGRVPAGWGARDRDWHFLYCDPDTLVLESSYSGVGTPDTRACIDTGCGGQLCSSIYEYSDCDSVTDLRGLCYRRHAFCASQADGTCGWIEHDGMLDECLEDPWSLLPDGSTRRDAR